LKLTSFLLNSNEKSNLALTFCFATFWRDDCVGKVMEKLLLDRLMFSIYAQLEGSLQQQKSSFMMKALDSIVIRDPKKDTQMRNHKK